MFSLLLVGKLFEKHHPTEMDNSFNSICEFNVMAMLYANFVFILFNDGSARSLCLPSGVPVDDGNFVVCER